MFDIVVACDEKNGIGKNNSIPWRCPEDMKWFRKITTQGLNNVLIMGRNTFESIKKPLKDRHIIVISTTMTGDNIASSLDHALIMAQSIENVGKIFIVGGGKVYEEAVKHPSLRTIWKTNIRGEYGCDVFFPHLEDEFMIIEKILENGLEIDKVENPTGSFIPLNDNF